MDAESTSAPMESAPQMPPPVTLSPIKPDAVLLDHFRRRVWPQLAQLDSVSGTSDRSSYPSEDIIERTASVFRPCYHALMAVAATCLAHQNGVQRLDALQHYQQVPIALQMEIRSAEDVSSDGAFLTHYLLLVYEIVSAEMGGANLWSQHLNQLNKFTLLRQDTLGGERFPFITWWTFQIDLYALLSGSGPGDYVENMLKNDIVPLPSYHLAPLGPDGMSLIYPEEADTLPLLLQLNYEVVMLAARLGLLAKELRIGTSITTFAGPSALRVDTCIRNRRIFEIQEALRRMWTAPNILHIQQSADLLPPRPKRLLEHANALFRACIIYSHTSMWPGQRIDTGQQYDTEIAISVQEILQIAEAIVSSGRLELRFIIFPLFMAGIATGSGPEKMMALDLMMTMEKESIGTNTTATRQLLQTIYERQNQRFMSVGHSLDVCWKDVMLENDVQLFNFGL
ncbi:hypothetical protein UCRPC4_g05651 [Phaeomoniella chlamydospora]|uniref:Uncharacterized protein n=1 Tax=Phaeomoniella chlamydospora TaxID=158046 RepID=A0A0G2E2X8_PHACM|nr:hypothetical protein UCRPC4_g05651 [Phaeomoniella chlamydospora]